MCPVWGGRQVQAEGTVSWGPANRDTQALLSPSGAPQARHSRGFPHSSLGSLGGGAGAVLLRRSGAGGREEAENASSPHGPSPTSFT